MTRRPLIAGNWKLHLGPAAAAAHAVALRTRLLDVEDVDLAVFPTALSVPAVCRELAQTNVRVGVQQVHGETSGAHTGANAAVFARELGCGWALCGHSEVRQEQHATDDTIHASVRASLRGGLLPLLCVGETAAERDADQLQDVLERQLSGGLGSLHADEVATVTLAYEPVWAIGTGRVATDAQAQDAHARIRAWLAARYPAFVAAQVRVLYGGSVKASNAASLLACPDVDGALVGGASLDVDAFVGIVSAARGA